MSELLKSYLASFIRAALLVVAGSLLKHGASQVQANGLIALIDPNAVAGAIVAAGTLLWSLYHKRDVNTKLVVAAATGLTTATNTKATDAAVAKVQAPMAGFSSVDVTASGVAPIKLP